MALDSLNHSTEGARQGYQWRKRYFVLEGNVLCYHDDQGAPDPLRIDLNGATIETMQKDETSPGYKFRITSAGRSFEMMASSEEEVNMWVDAIKDVLASEARKFESVSLKMLTEQLGVMSATSISKMTIKCCEFEGVALPSLAEFVNLTELTLTECKLTELPIWIASMRNLKLLDVSDNAIKTLPDDLHNLAELETLHLYKNAINALSPQLGKLTKLTELNAFNNKLLRLPAEINQLINLTELNLASNKFMTLPEMNQLTKLKRLAFFWNRVVRMPSLAGMISLEKVELYRNNLTEIGLGKHPNLQSLLLANNDLSSLPDEVGTFSALEELDIAKNKFETVPAAIADATSLQKLLMSGNMISELPVNLKRLNQLASLDLQDNKLKDSQLDPIIGEYKSLTNLFLANNQLTTLPIELKQLSSLKRVTLQGNDLDMSNPNTKVAHIHAKHTCGKVKGGRFTG